MADEPMTREAALAVLREMQKGMGLAPGPDLERIHEALAWSIEMLEYQDVLEAERRKGAEIDREARGRMPCSWEERVSDFADGALPAEAAEAVRGHLAECVSCQRWLEDICELDVLGKRYARERQAWRRDFIMSLVAVVLSLGACATAILSLWR